MSDTIVFRGVPIVFYSDAELSAGISMQIDEKMTALIDAFEQQSKPNTEGSIVG